MSPLYCVAAILLAGCSGCIGGSENSAYSCVVDDSFTAEQRDAVYRATTQWSDATDWHFFCAFDTRETGTPLIAFHLSDNMPSDLAGNTKWSRPLGVTRAYVEIRAGYSADVIERVALHEIGHALMLRYDGNAHYEGKEPTLMHADYRMNSSKIEAVDVAAFKQMEAKE